MGKFALIALVAFAAAADEIDATIDMATNDDCKTTDCASTDLCCALTDASDASNDGKYCIVKADAEKYEDFTDGAAVDWTDNGCYEEDDEEEESAMTLVAGAAVVATLALF